MNENQLQYHFTYPYIHNYVQNRITTTPDFMEKVVTAKHYLAMTHVHPHVITSQLGIIPCIECMI